jgi:hypothetical protein
MTLNSSKVVQKVRTSLREPFIQAVSSRPFKLFIANYSDKGFWQRWQLENSMLTDVKICLKYVHENHKACKTDAH